MRTWLMVMLVVGGLWPATARAQSTTAFPALWEERCARCHDNSAAADPQPPSRQALMQMTPQRVHNALTVGSMVPNATGLSASQIFTLVQGLSGRPEGDVNISASAMKNQCGSGMKLGPLTGPQWNGWSPEPDGSRFQSAAAAGLTPEQVPQLTLKWAFGFPGGVSAWGPVSVAGGWLFVGSDNGAVYALDPKNGCVHWSFEAKTGVRTAVSVGPAKDVPGVRYLAYFGDIWANVYAVDAETGKQVWMTQVEDYKQRRILASVVLDASHGRLYVPVTSLEGMAAPHLTYECCKFRGSVVALDVNNGKQIWKRYALPEQPQPLPRKTSVGTQLFGPAGGAVWNTPSIDLGRNTLYFGTGNDYIYPATEFSDAIVAVDLTSGQLKWRYQLLAGDANDGGCGMTEEEQRLNCPNWRMSPQGTEDVATSPMLRTLPGGRRVVIGMTQSTLTAAIDEKTGVAIWQRHASPLGPLPDGGVYGAVADAQNIYVPLYFRDKTGGMVAISIATGQQVWYTPHAKAVCSEPNAPWCNSGNYAAATVIPGVVFAGAIDGTLRGYSTKDGHVLWEYQTRRDFETVNGVPAKGGSIHFQGPTVVGGMLFMSSGWAGQATGNVLMAFGRE